MRWLSVVGAVALAWVVEARAEEVEVSDVRLGYTIVYVADVGAAVEFYERAFGLARRFVHESGTYAEMETGATALAFVSREQGAVTLPGGFVALDVEGLPVGMEIALVTADVRGAFARAVGAGAVVVVEPAVKPWGQTVAYVRDLDGTLVELCSPMGGVEEEQAVPMAPQQTMTILAVGDLQRSVGFYREVFGWPTRVEVPVLVEFELPDGRGLALYVREGFGRNTNQVPVAVDAAGGEIAGTELYFHCADLDGVIGRLKAVGARELSPLAARDWGDEVAYFADPDGNVIAVGRLLGD